MKRKDFNLKTRVNGLLISTVMIKKGLYETMVFDENGEEIGVYHSDCKKMAEHTHKYYACHYAIKRNCIRLVQN